MPNQLIQTLLCGCLLGLLLAVSASGLADDSKSAATERKSLSTFQGKPSLELQAPLRERPRLQKAIINPDYWVYSASTSLYFDDDGDGHYTRLLVEFDLDTSYAVADVYARLYLSHEGGPWLEYAITDSFSVYADSGDDSYVVETDLIDGYPFGYYDVLLEIYDHYNNRLLAEFGPADSVEFSDLPLEDEVRDQSFVEVVIDGGGGSTTMATVLLLALLCALRARRQLLVASQTPGQQS